MTKSHFFYQNQAYSMEKETFSQIQDYPEEAPPAPSSLKNRTPRVIPPWMIRVLETEERERFS